KDGGLHTFEYQLPIPNQGIQYYEARMTPSGPDEVIVIVRNITERTQAEMEMVEKLKLQEQLENTAAIVPGMIHIFKRDVNGNFSMPYASPAIEDVYGFCTVDVAEDMSLVFERIASVDVPHVISTITESADTMTPWREEFRYTHPQKGQRWYSGHSTPVRDIDGSILWYGIIQDITERKLAEAQLRTSEERFRSLFESSHAIMMIIDPNSGAIMDANPAAEKFYGYSHAQLTSMNISDINQLDPEKIAAERLKAVNAQQNYFVFPHRLASGEIRIVEVRSSRIELFEQTLLFSIISDITDRKQAELQKEAALEKLRESNETAQAILNAASESAFLMNLDGTVVAANETTAARLGKDLPGLLGVNMFNLLPPEVVETRRRYLDKVVHEQKSVRFEDQRFGVWIENNIYPIFDANGQVQRVAIFGRDITDRKQADEALKQSEEKFRLLAETIGEVFWMFDNQQQKMAYISPAYEKIWGRAAKSLYEDSQQYIDAILPEDRHIMFAALEKQARGEETEMEYRIVRLDGSICWINDRSFPIFDDTGAVIRTTGIATDITERKHNESLIYAQRDLARAFGRYQTILDGFPSFLQTIINVSGMDSGGIYLFDDGYKNLDIICHQGLGKDFVRMVNHFTVDLPQVKIILDGKPIYFSSDHPIVGNAMHQAEGLQCLAAIPILYQEQVVGCMNLASHNLAEVPEFARHVFETLAVEIGNFVIYLRNEETLRKSEEKYRTLLQELEQRVKERTAEVYAVHERLELATQAAELGTWDWSVQTNQL
ncbi:MAG: PAS domain S-box protein, partial [Chloroflexi bacterium]|nr:PAS domain S-box protein [Chloroflexota bacterium]